MRNLAAAGLVLAAFMLAMAPAYAGVPEFGIEGAQRATLASLEAAEDAFLEAQAKRDMHKMQSLLADDLHFSHASGEVQDRPAFLAALSADVWKIRAIGLRDRSSRIEGTAGVTSGIVSYTIQGFDGSRVARYLGVYRWRDRHWQLIAWQTTPLH